jgi:hypothetical protein
MFAALLIAVLGLGVFATVPKGAGEIHDGSYKIKYQALWGDEARAARSRFHGSKARLARTCLQHFPKEACL